MIELQGVSCQRGQVQALRGLDLHVAAGEVYALLGSNGAGKSTTLSLLLGFLPATEGTVRVGGIDPYRLPDQARALVAYLPEQVALYPTLSGAENLAYFSALADAPLNAADVDALFQRVGLTGEASHRRLATYSKGMRQKVGIAIAMARRSKVLLLDEPLSGLDPSAAREISKLLREVANTGVAVLLATHDVFRARQIADRIGMLSAGSKRAELAGAALDASQLEALYLQQMEA